MSDRRLRVLTLARDLGGMIGGAETLAYEFARRLDPDRFQSYVCTTREPEPGRHEIFAAQVREFEARQIPVLELNRPATWRLLPFRRLYGLLARERIDIIHAHMPRASVPGVILGRLARVPVIVSHEHGSVLDAGKRVRKLLDRYVVAPGSDVLLAVSEWDRRNLIEHERISPERVRVFRHGIAPVRPAGRDIRPELAPDGADLVGTVGRLYPIKGYDDLIEAIGIIKRGGRRVRCVIAGDGPDRERLEGIADRLGLREELLLPGFRDDVPELLAAFDVAVICSHSEGGPLAIIEYMAAGRPIVATDVGGIPELIEDRVHGLLVQPRDPAGLARGILRLLEDPVLARSLGDAARERQRTEFDIDITVRRLEQLYLELYAKARSDRGQVVKGGADLRR